jgi:hypothetical protein
VNVKKGILLASGLLLACWGLWYYFHDPLRINDAYYHPEKFQITADVWTSPRFVGAGKGEYPIREEIEACQ